MFILISILVVIYLAIGYYKTQKKVYNTSLGNALEACFNEYPWLVILIILIYFIGWPFEKHLMKYVTNKLEKDKV